MKITKTVLQQGNMIAAQILNEKNIYMSPGKLAKLENFAPNLI